jgi:ketosteroid isomerase-like protein
MQTLDFARHFVGCIEKGDLEGVRKCYAPGATIWHNFDDVDQNVEENLKVLAWIVRKATDRRYEILRLEEIEGGYLQQHALHLTSQSGEKLVMHACLVVRLEEGRIRRLEEYVDPAPASRLQGDLS